MNPVRCAVVGIGMMGSVHVRVLDALPEADLVACCDLDPGVAASLPSGVGFFADVDRLLASRKLEAVFVCTPQEQHLPVVARCLEAGLPVFCEKPIAHDLDDADAIIAITRQTGGRLAVGHTMRFEPDYLALARSVQGGDIGDPVSLSARRNVPAFEGRLLAHRTTLPVEVGVHDLDLLRWLAGDIVRVQSMPASTASVGDGAVDAVVATLRFASGAVGLVEFNWVMNDRSRLAGDYRLAVFGTRGAGYVEMRDPATRVYSLEENKWLRTHGSFDVGGTAAGSVAIEDRHFLGWVRGIRDWPVSLEDARAALEVALALDESSWTGRPVDLSR
ncbi:MAG: Gfo/Idh/MocA family oxidoreductase [bacterium]|nr:Gfo/Idh/MocA family oxidoreductase [bacterium]